MIQGALVHLVKTRLRHGLVTVCKRLQTGQTWEYFYSRLGILSKRDAVVQAQLLDLKQK